MSDEKIIQIIPSPANMAYTFDGCEALPVVCLAPVELCNGDREIHAMGLTNGKIIDDMTDAGAILLSK